MRLSEYIPDFTRHMNTDTRLSHNTKRRYVYEMGVFANQMDDPQIVDVTPRDILRWHEAMRDDRLAQGTVGQKHAALRKYLQYLTAFERNGYAEELLRTFDRLPALPVVCPRKEAYTLTAEQIRQLIEAAGERPGVGIRDRAMIHFLWDTGIRRAELRDLTLQNLDLNVRQAQVVGKGNKQRPVFFEHDCQSDLKDWLQTRATWKPECEQVFISATGKQLNLETVSSIVREAGKTAGLPKGVWTNVIRHSRITHLVNLGDGAARHRNLCRAHQYERHHAVLSSGC